MVPVLGAGYLLGWALVTTVWFLSCALFAAAIAVQDSPSGFEALRGSPGFGMVLLASDLAHALAVNLAAEELESAQDNDIEIRMVVEKSVCCSQGGHTVGCRSCQQILRRFPATLARMEEALVVSYRWQAANQALVHPTGFTGQASCAGMKDGIVGINMSRWQRQRLLAAIESNPYPYVWLDALSIPAAVLGSNTEHDPWLLDLSNTLFTRMMAVYSAGGTTIVLRSSEAEGGRYHQRAWTLQEFCGSRAIAVCSEENAEQVPYTPEEDSEFSEMRRSIKSAMRSAMPFWGQRLLRDAAGGGNEADRERKEALIRGIEAFAKAQEGVKCQEPVDKVRALLPLFLNSPVQDAMELRDLVEICSRLSVEGCLTEEAKTAIAESQRLIAMAAER
jgi:hypothetical protein